MQNGVMIQFFHWYTPENVLWKELKEKAGYLSELGITSAWLPPAYKAASGSVSVGYDTYDLYDLGEFEQKNGIATRYGTKDEYVAAIKALHDNNIEAIVDVVVNHKAGGDEAEPVMAVKVDAENRTEVTGEPEEIEAFTKFTFPERAGKYSDFEWNHKCFTGVDFNNKTGETSIYRFINEYGDDWEEMVSDEKGNYDYLMFADIEFRNPAVREEILKWAKWYFDTVGYDGVRLDAVKHISPSFFNEWLVRLRQETGREIFAVAEYWAPGNLELLTKYIEATDGNMSLFDAALHHNLHNASKAGAGYDMRTIFNDSLVQAMPDKAVTLTDNHDTQPLQALEAPVEEWFKPIAYALILLRQDGYPCVFYPDLFGCSYKDHGSDGNEYEIFLNKVAGIEELLTTRKFHGFGEQKDYFDRANCIGWTRGGDGDHSGCAVLLTNSDAGTKAMEMGMRYAGKIFTNVLGKEQPDVIINNEGWGEFTCGPGQVAVYVESAQ